MPYLACLPATPMKVRGRLHQERENKEDGRLMIVFRRLLRTSESNTELYRGIHYNIQSLNRDYTGHTKGSSIRRLLRTSKSITELYKMIHCNIQSLNWDYNGLHRGHVVDLIQNNSIFKARRGQKKLAPPQPGQNPVYAPDTRTNKF